MSRPFSRIVPLAVTLLLASTAASALSLAEYQQGRKDAAVRESQDAYLFVTFQGMLWYGTALRDGKPDATLLFCTKPDEVPGEQTVADLIQAETTAMKGDEASTTPMEMVMLRGAQKRFPCKG